MVFLTILSFHQGNAAVIYTDLSSAPQRVYWGDLYGVQVNLVTKAIDRYGVTDWDWQGYFSYNGLTFVNASGSGIVGTGTNASALTAGTLISSASSFITQQYVSADDFNITAQQYLGLSFLNESTGQTNYGWLLLSTTRNTNQTSQGSPTNIIAFAYEDSGAGLMTGLVPEPSKTLLFTVALLSLFLRRQRCLA